MQENFTSRNGNILPLLLSTIFAFFLGSFTVSAQTYCANETVIWAENFGSGTTPSSHPDIININYNPTGNLEDGQYRIANSTQQKPEWHASADHTGGVNGNMLVINGSAETFYSRILTNGAGSFIPGSYAASLYLMNINTPGTCSPNPLLPTITFVVEYNTSAIGDAGWASLQNVTVSSVPQSPAPTWIQLGGVFNLPVLAQRIRLTMSDGISSGCGNDFAIDDIQFATCPAGGPLPVEFLSISAVQKGGGVSVNWATASELNNKYFDIEKSVDGNNWTVLSSVNASGIASSSTKNYSGFDPKPVSGYNYYRIKQVDLDGNFKYSIVVKLKLTIDKTGVSVLTNPFVNRITVDFLSSKKQPVSVSLTDISGKMIATETWQLVKGSTRLNFDRVSNIQRGIYIFTVRDETGAVIYNNKLVKQ